VFMLLPVEDLPILVKLLAAIICPSNFHTTIPIHIRLLPVSTNASQLTLYVSARGVVPII
jgi:hypothetical protein